MQQQGRILDGDLETLGLQATLKMLALSGKTGTLIVTSGQESLSLYLNKGQIAALDDNFTYRPNLLEVMRLLGRIDDKLATEIYRAVGPRSPALLETLVDYRLISEGEMFQWLEFGVIQSLSRALRWVQGRFEFHRNMLHDTQLALNVDHVLLESLRQADEWDEAIAAGLSRTTVARWRPQFNGDVNRLGLEPDAINVLCLANGQLSLQAIAYALLISEARVAQVMDHLLALNLIEVVDEALESDLEHDLMNVLNTSQHELSKYPQNTPDQRLLAIIKTMSGCINSLLIHHGTYARQLRGRGALRSDQIARFLEELFSPLLRQAQKRWQILDTATFEHGQIDCGEIFLLNTLVKGEQLQIFYVEAAQGLDWLMKQIFATILEEEVGSESRTGRRLGSLWGTFVQEIEEKVGRNQMRGGSMAFRQDGGARRSGQIERTRDANLRMSDPRIRQIETDPRMLQARERRRSNW
jgi:hypothetical protein